MKTVDLPITNNELLLVVVVAPGGQTTKNQNSKGTVPPVVTVVAQIDTGSNVTGISARVVRHLNIVPESIQQTHTAGGKVPVKIYSVSLSIVNLKQQAIVLTIPTLTVMELPHQLPNIDVLLGMDVFAECQLLVDGPKQQFSLSA